MKKALTIAGSDSSCGAGIQADIKTFAAHGVYGLSVLTAVTAQNTQKVIDTQNIRTDIIAKQIDAVYEDTDIDAVKIGMVSNSESIKVIAQRLKLYKADNIVLDPVMISSTGYSLLDPAAVKILISDLIPVSTVLTPNIPEAEKLSSVKIKEISDIEKAAKIIFKMGAKNILIKGGHLQGDSIDTLYDGKKYTYFKSVRINTKNTHGTGCTFSSAIASNLALGMNIEDSVKQAKEYITTAIQHSLSIGKGAGPTNHFYSLYRNAGFYDK